MVSVIIPTYNRKDTILRSVNSILNQTYSDIEVIIVDDGSTDGTIELLKTIQDKRIKILINEKNMGACASRNRGIECSEGEYVAFQDSDDEWYKDKLEKSLQALVKNNADVVFCAYNRIIENENVVHKYPSYDLNLFSDKKKKLCERNCVSTQTILGKKICFQTIKFDEDLRRFQDWDLALRLVEKYTIYYIDEVMVNCYVQKNSISLNNEIAADSLEHIMEKAGIMKMNRPLKSIYFQLMGDFSVKKYQKRKYYFQSLCECFKIKTFAKLVLNLIR